MQLNSYYICFEKRSNQGLTLLELLVAMTIFAILSVIAYSGLASLINSKTTIDQESQRLAELQRAFMVLSLDVEQIVQRGIRDHYGDFLPAMILHPDQEQGLEFTRSGWRNPTAKPRSSLQRVAIKHQEKTLIRSHWYVLDRSRTSESFSRVILTKVTDFQIRFLSSDQEWVTTWPLAPPETIKEWQNNLPRAVDIILELEDWGRVNRIFQIASSHETN